MNRPINDSNTPGSLTQYASTAQVAQALGVSVTTVKRWVDEGILPAYKTAGKHRKLLMADVMRLVREGGMPQANLAILDPRAQAGRDFSDLAQISFSLQTALREGDAPLIRQLIHGVYNAGTPIETLADQVLCPAMSQIGHDWQAGRIDIIHEHRGTQMCIAALYELKAILEANAERDRPIAIGGSPEHDHYLMASLMAQMVLLDAGWQAINLGPHLPMSSLQTAVRELRPQIVWLSISHLSDPDKFAQEYTEFYKYAVRAGVAVAIGGQGLSESLRTSLPYTTYGDGLTQLAAFARTLNRRPQRPKRGRPLGAKSRPSNENA